MPTVINPSGSYLAQTDNDEAKLLNILNNLGQKTIPDLIGDFQGDLLTESSSSLDRNLEEQIGARLLLRMSEKVIGQVFKRHAEVSSKYSSELLRLKAENKSLQKEVKSLKLKLSEKDSSVTMPTLLNVSETQAKNNPAKRKKSGPAQVGGEVTSNPPELSRSGSRIFPKRISPSKIHSTQAHLEDANFVPETLQVASSPGCRKSARFSEKISVPDTPEKMILRPSDNIEQCVTPDLKAKRHCPRSPLIQNPADSSVTKKRKLFLRNETLKENKPLKTKTDSLVLQSKARRAEKVSGSHDKNNIREEDEEIVICKKVGKIDPGAQCEKDKKSYQQFDDDFPKKKTSKRSEALKNIPSDTDSDFESPNLLKRTKLREKRNNSVEASASRKEDLKVRNIFEDDIDDDIDVFDPSNEEEEEKGKVQLKKKKSKVRSENRWGIEVPLPIHSDIN